MSIARSMNPPKKHQQCCAIDSDNRSSFDKQFLAAYCPWAVAQDTDLIEPLPKKETYADNYWTLKKAYVNRSTPSHIANTKEGFCTGNCPCNGCRNLPPSVPCTRPSNYSFV